jgi:NADH-quinone oxidoreductase subunit M
MHMGYLFLGLLAATSGSLVGVVLLMVGHGLSVAGLFAVNGLVDQRAGTVEVSKLGGLAQKVPFVAFCFSFFTMASIGLPGLANFPGEAMIFLGSFGRYPGLTAVAVLGVVFSAVYMLRLVKGVFQGPFAAVEWKGHDISLSERIGLLLLMASLLVFGALPNLLARGANASLAEWLGGLWR